MPAFYLYRGKLHRPSDAPREWPMPPRTINPRQFKILTAWCDRTLARLANEKWENEAEAYARVGIDGATDAEGRTEKGKEVVKEEEEGKDRRKEKGKEVVKEEGKGKKMEEPVTAGEKNSGKGSEMVIEAASVESVSEMKMEESKSSSNISDKQKRIKEVEKKLEALKKKKHDLVQILKQISNVEEEFKRRNIQAAALRASNPLQMENIMHVDMGSVTKNVPKLSVEVNFGSESGVEFDTVATYQSHGHHAHHLSSPSPSVGASARPNHQNTVITYKRRMKKNH